MHGEDNSQEKPKRVKKAKDKTSKKEDSEPPKKEVGIRMRNFVFLPHI